MIDTHDLTTSQAIDLSLVRLNKAKLSIFNIACYFVEYDVTQVRDTLGALSSYVNNPGRPKEIHKLPSAPVLLEILRLLYMGFDLVHISKLTGVDINSIHYYLAESDSQFALKTCKKCRSRFLTISINVDKCPVCSPNENTIIMECDQSIKFCYPLRKDLFTRKEFGLAYLENMRAAIINHTVWLYYRNLIPRIFESVSMMIEMKVAKSTVTAELKRHLVGEYEDVYLMTEKLNNRIDAARAACGMNVLGAGPSKKASQKSSAIRVSRVAVRSA